MKNDELYGQLGDLIRGRRRKLTLTQQAVAARIGISRASLANIETGRQKVLVHQLYALAAALNLAPSDLLPPVTASESSQDWTALPLPDDLKLEQKKQIARLVNAAQVEPQRRYEGTMTHGSRHDPALCARNLLERLDIRNILIPVDKIARAVGAQVIFSPLDDELSGMVFVKEDQTIIGVNSLHHPNRQRFTISHEIGHLELHRQFISTHIHVDKRFTVLMRDIHSTTGTARVEIEANRFASELLMPEWAVQRVLEQTEIDIDDDEAITVLARKFRVSRQAFQYRLMNFFS